MSDSDAERVGVVRRALCGWCGRVVENGAASGPRVTHVICATCYPRVVPEPELTAKQLDGIPYGLLQLDDRGVVCDHENPRCRSLVGLSLFNDIAPFSLVKEFQDRYRAFLAGGESGRIFELAFTSGDDEIRIRIFFGRICADLALVRIGGGQV